MTNTIKTTLAIFVIFGVAACGAERSEPVAEVADKSETQESKPAAPKSTDGMISTGKPGAPYRIDYKIIGTPIVGSQLTIDLNVVSTLGPQPVSIEYRINDTGAMMLADAQPSRVDLQPAANELEMAQQVTIVPLREGRHYLNVSASFISDGGTMSTITAIPVQVGAVGRELEENGYVTTDENGELIRVLDGDE